MGTKEEKIGTTTAAPEATVPTAEATVPTAEATVPTAEATVPTAEATVPTAEATVPTALPDNLVTTQGTVSEAPTMPPPGPIYDTIRWPDFLSQQKQAGTEVLDWIRCGLEGAGDTQALRLPSEWVQLVAEYPYRIMK